MRVKSAVIVQILYGHSMHYICLYTPGKNFSHTVRTVWQKDGYEERTVHRDGKTAD